MRKKSLRLHVGVASTLSCTGQPQKFHPKEHQSFVIPPVIFGSFILTWLDAHFGSSAKQNVPNS